jgi:hypothetical protein
MRTFAVIALLLLGAVFWLAWPSVCTVVGRVDFMVQDAFCDEMEVRPLEDIAKSRTLAVNYAVQGLISLPFAMPMVLLAVGGVLAGRGLAGRWTLRRWLAVLVAFVALGYLVLCLGLIMVIPEEVISLSALALGMAVCIALVFAASPRPKQNSKVCCDG